MKYLKIIKDQLPSLLMAIVVCCLFPLLTFAQRDLKVIPKDYNKDGIIDTLRTYYDGGSGFGGRNVKIISGKTGEVFELDSFGCFCEIKRIIPIPPNLNKTENSLFLEAMQKEILPEISSESDPSLSWMIAGAFANNKLKDNPFFDLVVDPQIDWSKVPIQIPEAYSNSIQGDTLQRLLGSINEIPKGFEVLKDRAFLVNNPKLHLAYFQHKKPLLIDSTKKLQIYKTAHGIISKRNDKYKWLFISDVGLTGAPQKLRWESIGKIGRIGKYLIVHQNIPPDTQFDVFVINVETGILGRLKFEISRLDVLDKNIRSFKIDKESILLPIELEEEPIKFQLRNIFDALKKLYIKRK